METMRDVTRRAVVGFGAGMLLAGAASRAKAANAYGPGVTDTEIKLGTTSPYSGPASAYGVFGQSQVAYFNMINDLGGSPRLSSTRIQVPFL